MAIHFLRIDNDPIFKRVVVESKISDGVTIFWELRPEFNDPLPYTFYVDYNKDFNDPVGWKQIAGPLLNQINVFVPGIRVTGRVMRFGFRVRLITGLGEYVSKPASDQGVLTERQWRQYAAAYRRLTLVPRNVPIINVHIFKRKWHGPRCECVDPETMEITDINCERCFGTGIVGGYWNAGESLLRDISTTHYDPRRDPSFTRPTSDIQVVLAQMVGLPPIDSNDVIVRNDVDRRYYVRQVKPLAEVSGISVAYNIEMGVADFDDVVYKLKP